MRQYFLPLYLYICGISEIKAILKFGNNFPPVMQENLTRYKRDNTINTINDINFSVSSLNMISLYLILMAAFQKNWTVFLFLRSDVSYLRCNDARGKTYYRSLEHTYASYASTWCSLKKNSQAWELKCRWFTFITKTHRVKT